MGEVTGDGPLAEEELGRNLAIRLAGGHENSDAPFAGVRPVLTGSSPDVTELVLRPFRPTCGSGSAKRVACRLERLPGRALATSTSQHDPEREQRATAPSSS